MSSLITIAGSDGVPLDVSETRFVSVITGAWHLDLFIASPSDLTGAVTVNLADTLTLHGTVIDGGPYVEALHVRVLAGAGGWGNACVPKYYQGATLGFILGDILGGAGETLSTTSDASARSVRLPAFATTSGTVGANVRALMAYAAPGTGYRFLADGSFWIGPETWPAFGHDYQVTTENPTERRLDIGSQFPTLIAGQSVFRTDGSLVHLTRVEWVVSVEAIRARAWWGGGEDRLAAAWANNTNVLLGRKAAKTVDACALYWGRVVKVNGGMVDVQLDSTDIASPSGIPIYISIPGALTLAGGERVLVGFRNGDPSQPFVFGIEQGTSAAEATIAAATLYLGAKAGAKPIGLNGDSVDLGTWTATFGVGPLATCIISLSIVPPGGGAPTVLAAATPGPFALTGKLVASATNIRGK